MRIARWFSKVACFRYSFAIAVIAIAAAGALLRFVDYDRVPGFLETNDEFLYPWAGLSFFTTGTPTAWSWIHGYPNTETLRFWGDSFPSVSPWLEKPPLYSLITGGLELVLGARSFGDVRLAHIRVIPIIFSIATVVLTAFVASHVFGKSVGLIASAFYATTPIIVLANRFSLAENLLTPIMLGVVFALLRMGRITMWLAWIGSALAALTKQVGVVVGVVAGAYYLWRRRWKNFFTITAFTFVGLAVNPLLGWYYGWDSYSTVFRGLTERFRDAGLPEFVQTIFAYPTVSSIDRRFLDGFILLGLFLLFAFPFLRMNLQKVIKSEKDAVHMREELLVFAFPISYIAFLALVASGAHPSFYGWYLFPLFPFIVILVASALANTFRSLSFLGVLVFIIILGSSAIRYVFLFLQHDFWKYWQISLAVLVGMASLAWLLPWYRIRRAFIVAFVCAVVAVNIYTSMNLRKIYNTNPQPFSYRTESNMLALNSFDVFF